MEKLELLESILNSYPYPIVFVDNDYIIRYMNKNAKYHYYEERGYKDLIGKSLFDCHMNPHSVERIKAAWEGMKKNGKEARKIKDAKKFAIGFTIAKNITTETGEKTIYVRILKPDEDVLAKSAGDLFSYEGNWIGFIERFELNLQINHK